MPPQLLTPEEYKAIEDRVIQTAPDDLTEEQFNARVDAAVQEAEAAKASQPGPDLGQLFRTDILTRQLPAAAGFVKRNLPAIGAGAAALATTPFTGGLSWLPAMGVAGLAGAAGGAAGETGRRALEGQALVPSEIATEGAIQGAQTAAGAGGARALTALAPKLMGSALGSQPALRRKFPTVDIEDIALREGARVTERGGEIARAAKEAAGKAVPTTARAADIAGAPKVYPREIVEGLPEMGRAALAERMPDKYAAVLDEMNRLRKLYRTGATTEEALAGKTARQKLARSALPSANEPRFAPFQAEIQKKVAENLANAARARGTAIGTPAADVAGALTRSQETIALDKAIQNALRSAGWRQPLSRADLPLATLGIGGGALAGQMGLGGMAAGSLLPLLFRDPRALSMLAQGLQYADDPASRALLEALRVGLQEPLRGTQEPIPEQ